MPLRGFEKVLVITGSAIAPVAAVSWPSRAYGAHPDDAMKGTTQIAGLRANGDIGRGLESDRGALARMTRQASGYEDQ